MDRALRWEDADGWRIAFSTRAAGDLVDRRRRRDWLRWLGADPDLVVPHQVHGARIAELDDAAGEADLLRSADGVASSHAERGVGVFGADCPGLILIAGDEVVAAHCGWRGMAAGIVAGAVAVLRRRTGSRAELRAFIGPGISGARYQVDGVVIEARRWPPHALVAEPDGIHARLDLVATIAHDLAAVGVARIRRSDRCTAGDPLLWSFRHQGPGCSQLLAAWRRSDSTGPSTSP